jgi:hypothetical protein
MKRAAALIAVVLLAGCGSSQKKAGGSSTNDCTPLAGATTTAQLSPAIQNRETMYLTDVKSETLDCTERVVFELKGPPPGPGYNVSYQPDTTAKIEDGSGNPLAIAGSQFLVVKLQPALTAQTKGEKLEMTYTGPRSITPPGGGRHVAEIVKAGDFEAVVTWVIGLNARLPFKATASETQLVVEIG